MPVRRSHADTPMILDVDVMMPYWDHIITSIAGVRLDAREWRCRAGEHSELAAASADGGGPHMAAWAITHPTGRWYTRSKWKRKRLLLMFCPARIVQEKDEERRLWQQAEARKILAMWPASRLSEQIPTTIHSTQMQRLSARGAFRLISSWKEKESNVSAACCTE